MVNKFLSAFLTRTVAPRHRGRAARRNSPARRLRLETLENRLALSTVTVMSNADSGAGSLRAAIAGANSGDTIVFARSVHAITLTSGELLIPASLAIDGPGADKLTISGNNLSRVFEIAAGPDASNPLNVTISNLTITHGNAVAEGGGILNDGSNVTLSNDRITQNVVTESPTDLTPGTTEFYAQGGGLFSVAGNLSINNCHVIANQAVGLAGTNAYGDALGGGVSVVGGTVSITDSIFANNLAQAANDAQDGEAGGGGLQISAPLTLSDSTISGNRAVAGNNPTPYGPTGGGGGSASAAGMEFYSTAMISNCNFSSNEAFGGNGGTGVFAGEAEGGAVYAGGPGTFINCNFTDNLARAGSGGNGGTSTSSLASGVEPGVDTSYGGALCSLFGYAYGNSLNVTNSAFTDNKAVGGNNATATGSDIVEVGDAEGGAICSEIGTVATISGCTLDHNAAIGGSDNTGSGGQVAHIGDGLGGAIDSSFGSDGSDGHIGATTLTLSNSNLSARGLVQASPTIWGARPPSAAAFSTRARPSAVRITRPEAQVASSPDWAREAASSITWVITLLFPRPTKAMDR
ncbi:MAG: hypothetical protein ABSG53_12425 [Thermoguttaceae bacterium]